MTAPPRVLTVAGSDSSGGAGIQADLKTIAMLGGYGMSAITALTAQDTTGVHAVAVTEPALVLAQIDACLGDIGADAIKIGMIGAPATARDVAARLDTFAGPIVFDPVMVASSGAALADGETVAAFAALMDVASVVTPNLPELAALTGMDVATGSAEAVFAAAETLARRHGVIVLAKGGHGEGDEIHDRIATPAGGTASFAHARIDTRHTHGTGCTLSAALATLLAHRQPLMNAVRLARGFVRAAIEQAPGFGAGHGPLGHQAVRSLAAGAEPAA